MTQQLRGLYQQEMIGIRLMLRGFIGKGWMSAIEVSGAKNPEQRINIVQRLLWDTLLNPLW